MSTEILLSEELQYFSSIKDELLGNGPGKYALIKGQELKGLFETETDAVHQGFNFFGNVPFLVKRVTEVEPAYNFTSNLIMV